MKAKSIVIAAGARPVVPDQFSGMGHRILTHESVFGLEKLPKSAAFVGAGPLGVEFAVAFARNTLVDEKCGKQSQSIEPSRDTRAAVRQSPINA